MNEEEEINQQDIDELLATASIELADISPTITESELPESSSNTIDSKTQESSDNNETDLTPPISAKRNPLSIVQSLKDYSINKKLITIIMLFLFFITGGAFLGFALAKKTVGAKQPLEKITDMGITFEEKNMVSYAGRGDKEIVTAFIDAGMPINSVRTTDGWTPLIASSFFKKTTIVEQLLEQKATVNIQDKYGKTPLMYAAAMGAEDIVGLLLAAGADPNIQDKNGRTALMEAYSKQQAKIAETLKNAGADPNLQPISKTEEKTAISTVKKEQKASSESQIADESRLSAGQVGLIRIGMSIEDLQKKYTNITVRDQFIDGSKKSIATIYLNNKKTPSLKVELTSGKIHLVSLINTYDEQFATDKNITVKSTVGDICEQYPISDIKVIDNSLFLVVKSMKMLFEIDTKNDGFSTAWLETNNPQSIPSNTRITRIINY